MQPSSPSAGFALVASAEMRAVLPVASSQAVVRVARAVRAVASVAVGSRRGGRGLLQASGSWCASVRAGSSAIA